MELEAGAIAEFQGLPLTCFDWLFTPGESRWGPSTFVACNCALHYMIIEHLRHIKGHIGSELQLDPSATYLIPKTCWEYPKRLALNCIHDLQVFEPCRLTYWRTSTTYSSNNRVLSYAYLSLFYPDVFWRLLQVRALEAAEDKVHLPGARFQGT